MRTRRLIPPIFALMAVLHLSSCAQTEPNPQAPMPSVSEQATALLEDWDLDDAPGVAVAISLNGETVFASGNGIADLDYGIPITPDTVFKVASVSKQFTAFSIFLLQSDGLLDVNEDIRTYLPGLPEFEQPVKVAHLLDHMGGLREGGVLAPLSGWLEDDVETNHQFRRLVARQRGVNFASGTAVEYSNSGYLLLAQIVETVSGQSFQDFTRERLFDPLEMTRTQFYSDRTVLLPNHAKSYAPKGDGYANIHHNSELVGSTGLTTTVHDLLNWAANFETRQIGSDELFQNMAMRKKATDGRPATFGRGHERRQYNGLETWSHGGRIAGYRSFLLRVPSETFAISILSNRSDFDTAKIAFGMVDIFLSDNDSFQLEAPAAWAALSVSDAQSYEGDYELYPGTLFQVRADGSDLTLTMMGSDDTHVLPQVGQRRFALDSDSDLFVEFEVDDAGRPTALLYVIGLHGSLRAPQIELEPYEPSPVSASDYAGRYYSEELATSYEVNVEDGVMTATHIRLPVATLSDYQPDMFRAPGTALGRVKFVRDASDVVIGAQISAPLVSDIWFERIVR